MESALAHGAIDLSPITDGLYISDWPDESDAPLLAARGIRLLLSMHWRRPPPVYQQLPFSTKWLPTIDSPLMPIPVPTLRAGVLAALPVLRRGDGVLAHCVFGRHRGVAMACCVLIGLGRSAEEAIALVEERRAAADPYAWYIQRRIKAFERDWTSQHR
ncbi:MAG: dual specificity protein phosphatase [Chloroflexi bacterium]|nr:dual specificity protein phosphatase [Chloroflexota bacterium]